MRFRTVSRFLPLNFCISFDASSSSAGVYVFTIESLEAEITQLRNLTDNAENADNESYQYLRDEAAIINHMLFGDDYPVSEC